MLKKENQQLTATLKRYRKQLQDISATGGGNTQAKDVISNLISPSKEQDSSVGKKLKRSDSGTSSITMQQQSSSH